MLIDELRIMFTSHFKEISLDLFSFCAQYWEATTRVQRIKLDELIDEYALTLKRELEITYGEDAKSKALGVLVTEEREKLKHQLNDLKKSNFNSINLQTFAGKPGFAELLSAVSGSKVIQQALGRFLKLSRFEEEYTIISSNSMFLLARAGCNFNDHDLRGIRIKCVDLSRASFFRANLANSHFQGVKLQGCNFQGANLENIKWVDIEADEISCLRGHGGTVYALVLSADCHYLASGSDDNTIRVWNLKLGQQEHLFEGHQGCILALAATQNWDNLASGGTDKSLRIWNLRTGEFERILGRQDHTIHAISYTIDQQFLIEGGDDSILRVWSLKRGSLVRKLKYQNGLIHSVSLFPAGELVAFGGRGGKLQFMNYRSSKIIRQLDRAQNQIINVQFLESGKTLLCCDTAIRLIDVSTNREVLNLPSVNDQLLVAAASENGKFVISGSRGRYVDVWNRNEGTIIKSLTGHNEAIYSIAIHSAFGLFATGSEDSTIRIWDLEAISSSKKASSHDGPIIQIAVSPDQKLLATGSFDRNIMVWDLHSKAQLLALRGHQGLVKTVSFSPEGKHLASGSEDGEVKLWSIQEGKESATLIGHTETVNSVAFDLTGKLLASCGDDYSMKLWRISDEKLISEFLLDIYSILQVAFSADSLFLVCCCSDNSVRTWSVKAAKQIRVFFINNYSVTSMAYAPYSNQLAIGCNKETQMFDLLRGKLVSRIQRQAKEVISVGYSPCLRYLITMNRNRTLWITSVTTRAKLVKKNINQILSNVIYLKSKSQIVFGGIDGSIQYWSFGAATTLKSHKLPGYVQSKVFSPDGTKLVFCRPDFSIHVVSPDNLRLIHKLEGHQDQTTQFAFTSDSSCLLSVALDSKLIIWNLERGEQILFVEFDTESDVESYLDNFREAKKATDIQELKLTKKKKHLESQRYLHLQHLDQGDQPLRISDTKADQCILQSINQGINMATLIKQKAKAFQYRYDTSDSSEEVLSESEGSGEVSFEG